MDCENDASDLSAVSEVPSCPLCDRSSRKAALTCVDCLRNLQFRHSTKSEKSYGDLQERYTWCLSEANSLRSRIEESVRCRKSTDEKMTSALMRQASIEALEKSLQASRGLLAEEKAALAKLRRQNALIRGRLSHSLSSHAKACHDKIMEIREKHQQLSSAEDKLKDARRRALVNIDIVMCFDKQPVNSLHWPNHLLASNEQSSSRTGHGHFRLSGSTEKRGRSRGIREDHGGQLHSSHPDMSPLAAESLADHCPFQHWSTVSNVPMATYTQLQQLALLNYAWVSEILLTTRMAILLVSHALAVTAAILCRPMPALQSHWLPSDSNIGESGSKDETRAEIVDEMNEGAEEVEGAQERAKKAEVHSVLDTLSVVDAQVVSLCSSQVEKLSEVRAGEPVDNLKLCLSSSNDKLGSGHPFHVCDELILASGSSFDDSFETLDIHELDSIEDEHCSSSSSASSDWEDLSRMPVPVQPQVPLDQLDLGVSSANSNNSTFSMVSSTFSQAMSRLSGFMATT